MITVLCYVTLNYLGLIKRKKNIYNILANLEWGVVISSYLEATEWRTYVSIFLHLTRQNVNFVFWTLKSRVCQPHMAPE